MKTIAVIVAAGTSNRFSNDLPKQYHKIENIPVLRMTIEKFLHHPAIDAVQVVINKDHTKLYQEVTKGLDLLPFVFGGESRQESVRNALFALKSTPPRNVLIHDAARPFVSPNLITNVVNKLKTYQVVDVGLGVRDTVKERYGNEIKVLDRKRLYFTQTPQGFDFNLILKLHSSTEKSYTDDVTLCIDAGVDVCVVKGENQNIKITYAEDLLFLQQGKSTLC